MQKLGESEVPQGLVCLVSRPGVGKFLAVAGSLWIVPGGPAFPYESTDLWKPLDAATKEELAEIDADCPR